MVDVESSTSTSSEGLMLRALQWGTLALMSRPLWPEDMETFCPSSHEACISHLLKHLNTYRYLATAGEVLKRRSKSTRSYSLACSFSLFVQCDFFYVRHFCSLTALSFHLSPSSLPRSSCRHDGIPRRITMTPDPASLVSET